MKAKFTKEDEYDDPVGNWWICDTCNERVFMAIEGEVFNYCPSCGTVITSFNGVSVCMDDSIIGSNYVWKINFKK